MFWLSYQASLKISDAELELWSPEFINEQLTKIKKALSPPVFNSPQGPIRAFVPKQVVGAAKDTFFKIFRQAMRGDPRAERAVEKLAEKFPQNYEFGHFGEYQQQEYLKRLITSGPRYILSKAEVEFALSNRKVKFLSFIFNSDFEDWSGAFASCEDEEVKKLYAVFSTHIDDPRDERLKPIQEWAAKAILPERSQSVSNEAFCFALHTLYDGAVLAHHAKSNENPCFLALLEAKGAYHNQRSFDSASLEMLRTIFNGVMRSN